MLHIGVVKIVLQTGSRKMKTKMKRLWRLVAARLHPKSPATCFQLPGAASSPTHIQYSIPSSLMMILWMDRDRLESASLRQMSRKSRRKRIRASDVEPRILLKQKIQCVSRRDQYIDRMIPCLGMSLTMATTLRNLDLAARGGP